MLVHLSKTSPYVCDLNRGPIEPSNRMASAPTKKAAALLEQKESFSKMTRTPLKLLAPDEVPIPIDSTITATDINASLQPVWYSEQTIVDDHSVQQEDIASIIQEQQGKSILPRTTLPPIPSESPSITEDEELLPNQPSLMHKSSTFTIEPSINVDSPLNDSEKENLVEQNPPTDDSFRALEQLLGLGSPITARESPKTNHDTLSLTVVTPTDIINATTTSLRMSIAPKSGSDSLPSSQDIPTMPTIESITSTEPPSFLVDNTTMEQDQTSYITTTATMNQENSFDIMDNDTIKDDINNDDETNFSFELNDFPNTSKNESMEKVPEPAPVPAPSAPMMTIRAPTCTDVAIRALIKSRRSGRISQPVKADSPLAKPNKPRSSAPTSRMLRSSCRRISTDTSAQNINNQEQQQPPSNTECFVNETPSPLIEVVSLPEEDENDQEKTTSVTLNLSSPKVTDEINEENTTEQNITPPKPMMPLLSREYTYNTPKRRASERRRSMLNTTQPTTTMSTTINQEEPNSSMLGILLTKPTETALSPVRKSRRTTTNSPSIASRSMLGVLLTQPTESQPNVTQELSPVQTSKRTTTTTDSPSIVSKSMLGVLLTQPTENQSIVTQELSPVQTSKRTTITTTANSPSIASKSMLNILLTQPTETPANVTEQPSPVRTSRRQTTTNSPSIVSKSMLGVLLTQPTVPQPSVLEKTLTISPSMRTSTRQSARSSSNPTPKVSINPLHSSTPSSTRQKSLQMVSIGEQEQVSTIVPQQFNDEAVQEEEEEELEEDEEQEEPEQIEEIQIIPLKDAEESIQQQQEQSLSFRTTEIGVQTTPSIDISTRRRLHKSLEQQITPVVQMNKSSSMVIINEEKQITPLQTKVVINLQRNVRFQLTPTTDARLTAKEKLEENLRGLKPDIVIDPTPIVSETIQQAAVKKVSVKKTTKPKKKKVLTSKKKKSTTKQTQPKQEQPVAKKPRQPRKERSVSPIKQSTTSAEPKKRAQRKQPTTEVVVPKKRSQSKEKVPKVRSATKTTTKRVAQKRTIPEISPPSKRTTRKRTIPEAPITPVEPVIKRAKTSKPVEVLPPAPTKTRHTSTDKTKKIPEPVERPTRTRSRSTNNKKENPIPTTKPSKRRLQSVEKPEGIKKKVVEGKIQTLPPVQNVELSQEERQKIEALTVAGLKSRLNTHKADVPKNAKKSDLIALLIKIETNLLKEQKQPETKTVNNTPPPTTTMTTRRRKN